VASDSNTINDPKRALKKSEAPAQKKSPEEVPPADPVP
jgi:hypothetical protein